MSICLVSDLFLVVLAQIVPKKVPVHKSPSVMTSSSHSQIAFHWSQKKTDFKLSSNRRNCSWIWMIFLLLSVFLYVLSFPQYWRHIWLFVDKVVQFSNLFFQVLTVFVQPAVIFATFLLFLHNLNLALFAIYLKISCIFWKPGTCL